MRKWLITAAGSLLFASIAFGQYKNTNPAPQAPVPQTPAPPPPITTLAQSTPTADPNEKARRITRDEALEMVKSGKAVWVDVRGKDQFDMEHIKGAINYPLGDLETDLNKKIAESKLPKNKFLITYCAWNQEHTSARAVLDMNESGIKNTAALLGGWSGWKSANLPTEGTNLIPKKN